MPWDRPNQHQWCTRNRRIVIERAFYRDGFEIIRRVNPRDYRWVRDDANEVRLFSTLIEAKAFARKYLITMATGWQRQAA